MTLWEEARDQFVAGLPQKDLDEGTYKAFLLDKATPEDAKATLITIQTDSSKKYGGSGGGNGIPPKWTAAIMSNIDTFVQVGSSVMNFAPETVKTGWFVVTQVLNAISNDYKLYSLFGSALGDMTESMVLIRHYDTLYHQPEQADPKEQELLTLLTDKIRDVYVAILDFGYAVSKHITGGKRAKIGHAFKDVIGTAKPVFDAKKEVIVRLKDDIIRSSEGLSQSRTQGWLRGIQDTVSGIRESQQAIKESLEELRAPKNRTHRDLSAQEFQQNKRALNPLPENEELETQLSYRVGSTGDWVFEHETYLKWITSATDKILWISGDAGSGKSVLLATMAQHLMAESAQDAGCFVTYLAGQQLSQDEKPTSMQYQNSILFSLYEIANGEDQILLQQANDIFQTPKKQKQSSRLTSSKEDKDRFTNFPDLFERLAEVTSKKKVFVIFDCIDQLEDQRKMSENLRSLCELEEVDARVVISNRQNGQVSKAVIGDGELQIEMHKNNSKDIKTLLESELDRIPGLTAAERDQAWHAVIDKTGAIFSYLTTVAIPHLRQPFPRPISKHLQQLPDDLQEKYSRAFQMHGPNSQSLLKLAITWILLAEGYAVYVNEIMDMYTQIYFSKDQEGAEDDYNNDPTTEPLYLEQMKEIAGPFLTFVEVNGQHMVKLQHYPSVKKFCGINNDETSHNDTNAVADEKLCPKCRAEHIPSSNLTISRKWASLDLTLKLLLHLNSPSFQRKWLLDRPKLGSSNVPVATSSDDKADTNAALKSLEFSEANRRHENTMEQPVNGDASVKNGVDPKSENSRDGSTGDFDLADDDDDESHSSGRSESGELRRTESLDSDELLHTDQTTDSDASSVDFRERFERNRYEIRWWAEHCQEVEALMTEDEKKTNPDFLRLQEEIAKFLSNARLKDRYLYITAYLGDDEDQDPDSLYWKPLHLAAWTGLTSYAKDLLAKGHDWRDLTPKLGLTALHMALESSERLDMIDVLLQAGADPNFETEYSTTAPICYCLRDATKEVVEKLLAAPIKARADLTVKFQHTSVLHWYAFNSTKAEILDLLLNNPNDPQNVGAINVRDSTGETPLHKLMKRSQIPIDMLEAFIKAGADVNAEDESSEQPLYEAANYGDSKAVEVILPYVKDIDDENKFGINALMAAARNGHRTTCDTLIKGGADPTKADEHSRTALFFACWAPANVSSTAEETAQGILDALVQRESDVETINMQTTTKRTPFREACGRGYETVVDSLLAIIDDMDIINLQDTRKGQTALHRAARAGNHSIVQKLLQKGADASLRDWSHKLVKEDDLHDDIEEHQINGTLTNREGIQQQNGDSINEPTATSTNVAGAAQVGHDSKGEGEGHTALELAVEQWETIGSESLEETVLTLIEHDPKEAAVLSSRLVFAAVVNGSRHMLEKLKNNGADLSKADPFGWTPLRLAKIWNNKEAADFIEKELAKDEILQPRRVVKPSRNSSVQVSNDGLQVSSGAENSGVCLFSDKPIMNLDGHLYHYFEVTILGGEKTDTDSCQIAIGLTTLPSSRLTWPGHAVPGMRLLSFGYDSDSGSLLVSESKEYKEYEKFGPGDTVGCGYRYSDRSVFFTLNGVEIDGLSAPTRGRLWPVIGVKSRLSLTVNFAEHSPFVWHQKSVHEGGIEGEDEKEDDDEDEK